MADAETVPDGSTADDWENYPVECHEAFLALTKGVQTATLLRRQHFIYPAVDEVLDNYLAYRQMFGD